MRANVLFSMTSIVAGLFDIIVDEIVASLAAGISIAGIITVVGKIEAEVPERRRSDLDVPWLTSPEE